MTKCECFEETSERKREQKQGPPAGQVIFISPGKMAPLAMTNFQARAKKSYCVTQQPSLIAKDKSANIGHYCRAD